MSNKEKYTQPEDYEYEDFLDDEDEGTPIDWAAYISKLLLYWKKIAIVTCIFGCLGIIAALRQKKMYQVDVILAPEVQARTSSSSSLRSIAGMLGMGSLTTGSSPDAINITLFPEVCASTPFLTGLFDVQLTSYVSPKDAKEGVKPIQTNLFDHLLGKDKEKSWFAQLKENLFPKDTTLLEDDSVINVAQLTSNQNAALKALSALITADVDQKTGITNISVKFDDQAMATQLADTVCARLQETVNQYRTQKERENLKYYTKQAEEAQEKYIEAQAAYAKSMDFDRSVNLLSITSEKERLQQEAQIAGQVYTQMVQQRELTRAKVQEMKPVFAVVEPATFPVYPVNSRKKTVIIFGFLGFVLAAAWYLFGKEFYEKSVAQIKEKIAEAKEANAEAAKS